MASGLLTGFAVHYSDLEGSLAHRELKDVCKADLPTPCMIVDEGIFENNLRAMSGHCRKKGIHLRAHVKVHKSPEIARRQVAMGAIGITGATVAECELLADAGISGLLLTRQPTSRNNIGRVVALCETGLHFRYGCGRPSRGRMASGRGGKRRNRAAYRSRRLCGLTRHGIEPAHRPWTWRRKSTRRKT